MTVLNLETVVLRGVGVACDNVTALTRMASEEARQGTSAVVLSIKRHLPSSPAQPEPDNGPRYDAKNGGTTVPRAGRLADSAGVLDSRSPATPGRALLFRGATSKTILPTGLVRTPLCAVGVSQPDGKRFGHPTSHRLRRSKVQANVGSCLPWQGLIGPGARQMRAGLQPENRWMQAAFWGM
jgi:hypothetical protein